MIFSFQIFYSWLQITSLQSNNVHLPSAPTCPAGPGRTPKTANKACSPFRKSLRKGITTRDARSSHLLMFSLNLHNHLFRDEKTEFREDKSLSVSQRKSQKSPQVWLQTQTPYIHNSPPLRWSKHILGQTGKKKKKKWSDTVLEEPVLSTLRPNQDTSEHPSSWRRQGRLQKHEGFGIHPRPLPWPQKACLAGRTKKSIFYQNSRSRISRPPCPAVSSWLARSLPGLGTDGYETSPHPCPAIADPAWFHVPNFTVVPAEGPHKSFSRIANDVIPLLAVEKASLSWTRK